MAKLIKPQKGKNDLHHKFQPTAPLTELDVVTILGGPFSHQQLLTDDNVVYLENQDDRDLPANHTATSLCNMFLRGPVLILEPNECGSWA